MQTSFAAASLRDWVGALAEQASSNQVLTLHRLPRIDERAARRDLASSRALVPHCGEQLAGAAFGGGHEGR